MRKKAAFTLVEMMIVMGILGCLAAITFPNFIKARSSSHRSVCIANLKQIKDAKITWSVENNKSEEAMPVENDLYGSENYLRYPPACPSRGTYTLEAVQDAPTCSKAATEGHSL